MRNSRPRPAWNANGLTARSGQVFNGAGEHELKGVSDRWHLYRVVG